MVNVIVFLMTNVLYSYISTYGSMCAVPNIVVVFSSLKSFFPILLLRYCLSDSEICSYYC